MQPSYFSRILLLLSLSFGALRPQAQIVDQFPADVTPVVMPPYSLFLNDYADPVRNLLTANIIFNDFNESSWTFRLKLRIESPDILLETRPEFVPSNPIVVAPGEPYQFTGADWSEYIRYQNLRIAGESETFLNSGRLPEGNYKVTLQVLDYATGEPLSGESSFFWWMGLFSPPLLNLPQENSYINPEEAQITFTWQLFNIMSPNGPATNYEFTLFEVTQPDAASSDFDPLTAFQNGQLLEIYRSDLLSTTSLVYGLSEPSLEVGKSYVYRVQAKDANNRDAFKNNGYSEFRRFYYGWPTGGSINLEFPQDDAGFLQWDDHKVRWSPPTNKLSNQPVSYELRIAEKEKTETPEEALGGNLWHYYQSNPTFQNASESHALPRDLDKSTSYAWEVIGYSSEQEVARSKAQTFHGPPLMERFKAGTHLVLVDRVNDDPNNLTGSGRVRLEAPGEHPKDDVWEKFDFEGLKVELVGSQWVLKEGEMLFEAPPETIVDLTPQTAINGDATFEIDQFRLDKDGLSAFGDFHWYLHLPSFAEDRAKLVTETGWVGYNDYTLTGYVQLADDNLFRLLEPFGYTLDIDPSSSIWIAQDNYGMDLKGKIGLPEPVKGTTGSSSIVQVQFYGQDQLFWMESENLDMEDVFVTTSTNIEISPQDYIIDFSSGSGVGHFADDTGWMGLQLLNYVVTVPRDFDARNQITMDRPEFVTVDHSSSEHAAYVDNKGLSFQATVPFDDPEQQVYLNTFPASVDELKLVIEEHKITKDSELDGDVMLPFLSAETPFTFSVDIDKRGFSPDGPVWVDNLKGYRFIHNSDVEEQRINVTVKRAVFKEGDHLDMVLDLEWPFLDLSMEAVQDFKMWGNYNIGFYKPEGIRALDRQIITAYKVYPYTVDVVTAGRSQGMYGLGVSGKLDLGEDVSGQSGLPSFNMYSLTKNELLPGDYVPAETGEDDAHLMSEEELENRIDELEAEIAAEKESVTQQMDARLDQAGQNMQGMLDSYKSSLSGGEDMIVEDLIETPEEEPKVGVDWEKVDKSKIIREAIKLSAQLVSNESKIKAPLVELSNLTEGGFKKAKDDFARLPEEFAQLFFAEIQKTTTDPLKDQINKLDKLIKDEVDQITLRVNGQFETTIYNVVNTATEEVVAILAEKYPDGVDVIRQVGAAVAASIVQEIKVSLKVAVQENVTNPVSILLQDQLLGRVDLFMNGLAEETVMAVFTPGADPAQAFTSQLGSVDNLISDAGSDVAGFLKPANLLNMVEGIGADFVDNIDHTRIIGRIRDAAIESLVAAGSQALVNGVADLTNQQLSEEAGVGAALAVGSVATQILSGGGLKKALANKMEVKHTSKLFDFVGEAWLNEDHPVYGEVFSGAVDITVKVPQTFNIDATYMNGRTKDGTKYWFVEVGGSASIASGNTEGPNANQENVIAASDKMGESMSDEMQPTTNGINLGIAEIMALRARLYKNMRPEDGKLGSMVPDAGLQFGAYMHLILFGPNEGTKMRLEVQGSVDTYSDGNLVVDFNGNVQVGNKNPRVAAIDPDAAIQGAVEIIYNKHERHFFGYATVVLRTTGICGEGSLLVDVKPGKWRIALGNREDRLGLVPGCVGPSFYGWVDLNSDFVEVGFGLGLAFYQKFTLGVSKFNVSLIVDAGINANVFASVGWKPVQLREVGLFIEMWARIIASYRALFIKGSVELVDLYLYASSTLRFNPKPVLLYGELKGHIRLLSILKFNFDKDYELEI